MIFEIRIEKVAITLLPDIALAFWIPEKHILATISNYRHCVTVLAPNVSRSLIPTPNCCNSSPSSERKGRLDGAHLRREAGPPPVPQLPRRHQDHSRREVDKFFPNILTLFRNGRSVIISDCYKIKLFLYISVPGRELTSHPQCVASLGEICHVYLQSMLLIKDGKGCAKP